MKDKAKLTFLGDISLNDDYASAAIEERNPFAGIEASLLHSDIVIGNLEAMTCGNEGENALKNTRLKVTQPTLVLLRHLHVNILTLANNHVYDHLLDGFLKTVSFLEQEKITFLGAASKKEKKDVGKHIITVNGRKFSFLNYVHPKTHPSLPIDCKIEVNIYEKEKIIQEIKEQKTLADHVILLLHWGYDNSRFPEPWQRKEGREFINAGADLIVGHHPHVLQGYEIIGCARIYYSLGNFAFSRHFNHERYYDLDSSRQMESVILNVIFHDEKIEYFIIPVTLKGIDVLPMNKGRIEKLSFWISIVSNPLIWPFYTFYLEVIYKVFFYLKGNGRNPAVQIKNLDRKKVLRILKRLPLIKRNKKK